MSFAPGSFSPIVYFENALGVISLPPTTKDAMELRPAMFARGFHLCEARTLTEARTLERRLRAQYDSESSAARDHDEAMVMELKKVTRGRLISKLSRSDISEYEKDFIREWLRQSDLKSAKKRKVRYDALSYFPILEFDESHARHHLTDATTAVPDLKDTACTQCRSYRKVPGSDLCLRCGGMPTLDQSE